MRNANGFMPSTRTREVRSTADVFRRDEADERVNTSVSLRLVTRNRLKLYAAAHGLKMQDVIEEALVSHLDSIGG